MDGEPEKLIRQAREENVDGDFEALLTEALVAAIRELTDEVRQLREELREDNTPRRGYM